MIIVSYFAQSIKISGEVEIHCQKYSLNQSTINNIAFIHLNLNNQFTRPLLMLSQIMLNVKNHTWVLRFTIAT